MDIRQLDMFRAVAEEGSFTKAAARLHVSQSAISRQVKMLEDELGGRLVHRGPRRVALTPPGELLLETATRVHRELQEVSAQISDTHVLHRGTLSLAGGMTVCMYILPRLLRRYRSLYRNVDLRVASGTSEEIQAMLRARDVDMALMTLPVVARDLEVLPVLSEEMVVVTAPRHPLSRRRIVEPAELAKYPLIAYEPGSNTRKVIDQFFLDEKIPMEVAMETENVEIIKSMVSAGLGITIIPYMAIARDYRYRHFGYARVRGWRLVRETGWVYLKADRVPRAIAEMLRVFDQLKDQFNVKPPEGAKKAVGQAR
jgi:DNA-binding transcriptional LysR family regulator